MVSFQRRARGNRGFPRWKEEGHEITIRFEDM